VLAARGLRSRLGPRRFAFHPTGFWIVLDEDSPYGMPTWSFDLARPLVPRAPLLLPGIVALGLVVFQLVPLPVSLVVWLNGSQAKLVSAGSAGWRPLTLAATDTLRGFAFLSTILALHSSAALAFGRPAPQRRLRVFLAGLGVLMAIEGLAQVASGTRLIYGLFRPTESDGNSLIFGPFVNRNHFAGYFLMLAPLSVGLLVDGFHRYVLRLGGRPNVRRCLVALQSPEGLSVLYAIVPAVACVGVLVATTSRGALAAFLASIVLAVATRGLGSRRTLIIPVLLLLAVISWFGLDRLGHRWQLSGREASGRTVVWRDSLAHMGDFWKAGSGFNTFGTAVSRVSAWTLPKGATPWREPYETSVVRDPLLGFRAYTDRADFSWYREAHNDYLQVLVEMGVPGLLIALWALAALLRSARGDAWVLAALAGVALHSLVEFDLQVPAVAVLFACVSALHSPRLK
jgi:hypothetical protein